MRVTNWLPIFPSTNLAHALQSELLLPTPERAATRGLPGVCRPFWIKHWDLTKRRTSCMLIAPARCQCTASFARRRAIHQLHKDCANRNCHMQLNSLCRNHIPNIAFVMLEITNADFFAYPSFCTPHRPQVDLAHTQTQNCRCWRCLPHGLGEGLHSRVGHLPL